MFRLAYIIIVILVSFITSIRCDEIVTFMEGDEALLVFLFPCNSTKITLQYGDRDPFFDSTNPWVLSLPPGPQDRFTVANTTKGSRCLLHLNIVPVTRDDAGTYILFAYTNDYKTRVGLDVEFLPGLPRCRMAKRHVPATDWLKLSCQATVGSMVGQIQCYQNGMEMPPLSQPYESSRMLQQTILVKENAHLVFCCSSPAIEPKEMCECKDFVWDPLVQDKVDNTEGPCPVTTTVKPCQISTYFTLLQSPGYLISQKVTGDINAQTVQETILSEHKNKTPTKASRPTSKNGINFTIALFVILFVGFVILAIGLTCSKIRSSPSKQFDYRPRFRQKYVIEFY